MTDHSSILDTFEAYAVAYCNKDIDRLMMVFDEGDDISMIGTGADELCENRLQVKSVFERNFAEATAKQFEWHSRYVTLRGTAATVAASLTIHIDLDGNEIKVPIRWTVSLIKRGEKWKWLHRHASSAAGSQEDGAAYPTSD